MSDAIARCDRCQLSILEGESYAMYGGNTLHSHDKCIERLTARVAELEELLSDWRLSVDLVRSAGVDSAHAAKMIRNGVERRMYEAARQPLADGERHEV